MGQFVRVALDAYWADIFVCSVCGASGSREHLPHSLRDAVSLPSCPRCGVQWVGLVDQGFYPKEVEIKRHALRYMSVHRLCGHQHAPDVVCPEAVRPVEESKITEVQLDIFTYLAR